MASGPRVRAVLRLPRGETNQWYPDLVYDNHPRGPAPKSPPKEGYHLSTDLVDKAIEFIQDAKALAPDKPFFMYFCPGAAHAPHHIFQGVGGPVRGPVRHGLRGDPRNHPRPGRRRWGSSPDSTELSPINPYAQDRPSPDGQPWPDLDTVCGPGLTVREEQRLFARMAEVYAGFLSHADHEIGRMLDYLEQTGQLDNTSSSSSSLITGHPVRAARMARSTRTSSSTACPIRIEENLALSRRARQHATYNHYPTGWAWAFNTPFKMWKRYGNLRGGTADPLIVSLARRHPGHGGFRRQYCHPSTSCRPSTRPSASSFPGR